jgi:hypothetical protein
MKVAELFECFRIGRSHWKLSITFNNAINAAMSFVTAFMEVLNMDDGYV